MENWLGNIFLFFYVKFSSIKLSQMNFLLKILIWGLWHPKGLKLVQAAVFVFWEKLGFAFSSQKHLDLKSCELFIKK